MALETPALKQTPRSPLASCYVKPEEVPWEPMPGNFLGSDPNNDLNFLNICVCKGCFQRLEWPFPYKNGTRKIFWAPSAQPWLSALPRHALKRFISP